MASCLLLSKEYEKTVPLFQKTLDVITKNKTYQDAYYTIRLLMLISSYEQEEFLLLPHLIRSFNRKIKSEEKFYSFWRIWYQFFKNMLQLTSDKQQIKTACKKLKENLLTYQQVNSKQAKLLKHFPYIEWAESQISSSNIFTLLKESSSENI